MLLLLPLAALAAFQCLLVLGEVRVAVIGAGIGGSASAYYVRQLLGDEAAITVFERDMRVGGRVEVRGNKEGEEEEVFDVPACMSD